MTGIFVAGHNGMVGSAICRRLNGEAQLLTADRSELDLTDQTATFNWLDDKKPDVVVVAAAKVGGIGANNMYPAEFITQNLMIETNLIHGAFQAGCERLLFLGSSCIYPKLADQPMKEESLLSGPLEPTNEPYALAKIAGIKLCESFNRQYGTDYRSLMPTNLYGSGDNFNLEDSHVVSALIRRFHEAKDVGDSEVAIWGTGKAMRELLHVDDLADACAHILELPKEKLDAVNEPMCSQINVGTGEDVTIKTLAQMIRQIVGYEGELVFDTSKPDGAPRKLLDVSKIKSLGWKAKIGLEEGLRSTYDWFVANQDSLRR
ncbi:MAG: GDP-L-fucose synthase [Pseudomonadales bacterium]|nr:GDP-L-fucose synthase [Pseudomonadales bacterium]MBO6702568.1 GDP-L-fucose synthase [Pseudomonadales bacterium]MBO7006359.1 GDP-L-fucose synthase [Pseudomonadales bacterium]